jgi:hypothetical protein
MGSFVQSSLGSGEQVLLEAKIHWVIFLGPILLVGVGVAVGEAGLLLSAVGGLWLVAKLVQFMCMELAVTNRKVLAKFGFIRRNTIEQQLSTGESIQVNQGLIGRMVGAGSVRVNGSGLSATPIPGIADPLGFRRVVTEAMEKATGTPPTGA